MTAKQLTERNTISMTDEAKQKPVSQEKTDEKGQTKKPYSAPEICDHGGILELTQSGGSKGNDGFGTKKP